MVRDTLFQCCGCRRQVSATAGTIFQDTRKPLVTWFRAMWYVTSQKNGASALGLQRVLGLASYETAWTWLHKLRRAMVRPDRDRLSGWVEVDETLVGGLEEGASGRQTARKAWVVIAAQADGAGIGRIRMRMIRDCSAANLHLFVEDSIEPGSVIHHGRLASLLRPGEEGLSAGDHEVGESKERRLQVATPGSSGRVVVEALVAGHTPRRGGLLLPALLSG